jgi:acetyl esterase
MPFSDTPPETAVGQDSSSPQPNDEVLRYFEQNPGDDTGGVSDIGLLRAQTHDVGLRVRGALQPIGMSTDLVVHGVRVRRYTPENLTNPRLGFIWIHGGGWMHGDLDVYDGVARAFANQLGCEVVAVDYALAPEHPFPAGLDDVWNVVLWAEQEFEDIVVAGDSSGGTLAAAASIKARDNGIRIAAQLLIYPVLESSDETSFKQGFRTRFASFAGQENFGESTYQRIKWIWDVYAPDPELRESSLATPMRAESLGDVAPAVILTAEHDILRGEAEAYAARLRADGVRVELIEFAGQIHGFLQMRGVLTDAQTALEVASDALRRSLAPEPARTAPIHPASKTKES